MKNGSYGGYWGRGFFLFLFILGIVASVLCGLLGNKLIFLFSVGGNIFFWVGLWFGISEGSSIGKYLFIQDMEEDKHTREIYLERFNKNNRTNRNQM